MFRKFFILICFLTFGLFAASFAQAATLSKQPNNLGLVGYWSFNEGAGAKAIDSSGNGNTGAITGATWVDGKRGKALSFNGVANTVSVSGTMSLNTSGFTFSHWVKTTSASGQMYTIGNAGASDGYRFGLGSGKVAFLVGDATHGYTENVCGTKTVNDGNWHLITGTYQSGVNFTCYIDGIFEASVVVGDFSAMQVNAPGFGKPPCCVALNGSMDEIRIYNRALSAAEILALYQSGSTRLKSVDRTGLVGYWSFNEGSGTQAGDSSGNGKTGTFVGSPTWADGSRGKAVHFSGSTSGISTSLWAPNPVTISLWMKPDTTAATASHLVHRWGGVYLQYSNSAVNWSIYNGSSFGTAAASSALTVGRWYHVVATYDGASYYLYINGVQDGTGSNTGNYTPTGPISIGCRSDADWCDSAQTFQGSIDDVRIYNRALAQSEITTLYKSGETKINASQNNRLTSGLVGMWSFNGADINLASTTAEVLDRSGNNNNGDLVGAKPIIGKVGQALKFSGQNSGTYVNLGTNAALNPANLTISAWVKPGDVSGSYAYIYSNSRDCCGTYNGIDFRIAANKLYSRIWNGGAAAVTSNGTISNNSAWAFVTVTYDGSKLKLYINGQFDNSVDTTLGIGSPASFSNDIGGMGMDPGTYAFDGSLDEVRLYNRALSAAEIKQLYDLGR